LCLQYVEAWLFPPHTTSCWSLASHNGLQLWQDSCYFAVCMYMIHWAKRGSIIMMTSFIKQVVILHLGLKTVSGTRIQRKVEEGKIGWD